MSSRPRPTPTSPLPTLFLLEVGSNIAGAAFMLLYPSAVIDFISHPSLTYPLTTTSPAPSSIQLLQWLGAMTIALSTPLLLGARDTPRAKASRRMAYETLGAGEVALVAVMLWQATKPGNEAGSITAKSLVVASTVLGGIAAARLWALTMRPEWFGSGETIVKKKR